jgi:hypothetical protein
VLLAVSHALLRKTEHSSPRNRFYRERRQHMITAAIGGRYPGKRLFDSPLLE